MNGPRSAAPCAHLCGALRDCGDGLAVLLPVYLTGLGFSVLQPGLIATSSLFEAVAVTLAVGVVGSPIGLRGC